MTNAMAHRGPDADGFFTENNISFGHRRLSIIDLSAAANQPFLDASGRYVLVFNGELYNFQEVRRQISGYPFSTSSDTEVLIAAWIQWGSECIKYFRGMFAFVIWDRQEQEVFMARDPMGVKPLYYYRDDHRLLFASEVRSLLSTGLIPREADPAALADYFRFQSVSYPHTPIRNIQQLEAGTWLRIGKGRSEKLRYWNVADNKVRFDFDDKEAVHRKIRELLLRSVERRLVSDVPVGAFLSGGIDSSAVVGLMAEASTARPNTFNITFQEKEYDESHYAGIVAENFNTVHTRILLKPETFLEELGNALDAMDSPSGDGINSYVVSRVIRQKGMTVALSGIGGDELFAGYPFFAQYLRLQANRGMWKIPKGIRQMLSAAWPASKREGKMGKMLQLLQLPSAHIDQVYPVFRQILSPQLLGQLTRLGELRSDVEEELTARACIINRLPLLSQVSVAEYLGYTQHTLLKDTDQMGMAASLEVREPFFDQDLVEFVLAVPDSLKRPLYPKSLLVESLKPLLPDEIVHRPKQGFLFPWDTWLRNDLRSFADARIRRMAERSFVQGGPLLDYWKRFLAGDPNTRWAELWLFIVLEYWMEKNGVA